MVIHTCILICFFLFAGERPYVNSLVYLNLIEQTMNCCRTYVMM